MELAFDELALLLTAGICSGIVNAVAGGGTFFTFPALMAIGLSPLVANASNLIAVWPGHGAAIFAYRDELARHGAALLGRCAIALAGGLAGALLLLVTGERVFAGLVPWLLLVATLLFALGPMLNRFVAGHRRDLKAFAAIVEFVFAVYGGYFGAGLGVLLMAALTILGADDIQEANALKNLLATVVTSVAIVVFVSAGVIAWTPTLVVLAGAAVGGYAGARLVRRIDAAVLRIAIVGVGICLTAYYFWRHYLS
jgi:uncharacterized protein